MDISQLKIDLKVGDTLVLDGGHIAGRACEIAYDSVRIKP